MSIFLVKVIFIYIVFIVAVNILGKSALAQLTPHDFGAILFLSYLAFGSIKVNGGDYWNYCNNMHSSIYIKVKFIK